MLRSVFFLISFFIVKASEGQLSQKIDSVFQSFHEKGLFDGVALIADSSGIVFHKSFGIANHDYKIPNATNTLFRLGSLEKQFTAMLVLQLVEKGKISLDGKISDYLSNYRKETGRKVTIKQLLTHTSGIPNYTALPNVWNDSLQLVFQPGYILHNFCSGDLEFNPGTKYKYNNTDYFILAQIIQQVTGKPLAVTLKENILIPAEMNLTGLVDNKTPIQNRAYGYYRLADTYVNEPYIHVPNTIGAASIYSTAYDLYLWDRILYSDKLLSYANMKLYLAPQFPITPDYAYGFGWEFTRFISAKNDTIRTMEHSGAIRAFRANVFRIPEEKKCIILLSNTADQSAYDLFEAIMRVFRGREWNQPKYLLADTLFKVMQTASLQKAISLYKTLKRTDSTRYDYSSYALELLGERLLLLSKYAEAVAIFELAVEEDPTYTYGYLYIGRAYEKWGKLEKAIEAYEKAVMKDKGSRPGIDAAFQIKYLRARH